MHVACPDAGPLAAEVVDGEHAPDHPWHAGRSPGLGPSRRRRSVSHGFVRVIDPDVVHLHSSKAGLAGRLALRGRLPTVFEPNGWSFLVGGAVGALALRWERLVERWCDVTVCVERGRARRR